MTKQDQTPLTRADDMFDARYAEKIWALIPEVYRNEDGLAQQPGRLRALVEVLAEQAAIARRSVDRLWADTRPDEADDWAVPYMGALVGARPVSALNRAGNRANLLRTILYRRRQGTVRLSELLADDIADWDAVASEAFLRLIRNWHMLDGPPEPGAITNSPKWGYADLRAVRLGDLIDSAHSDLSHYPDVRRHRGVLGRYGIPKVNLHLFRHYAVGLGGVTPREIAPLHYTLDPSGRDTALYQPGGRIPEEACAKAEEWQMRAPIPCRRLGFAQFSPDRADAPAGLGDLLAPIFGRRFATEAEMLEAAEAAAGPLTDAQSAELVLAAMEHYSPRFNLVPGGDETTVAAAIAIGADTDGPALGPSELYAANLAEWGIDHGVPGWVLALLDPERGRLRIENPLVDGDDVHLQQIHYGTFAYIGAGGHDRSAALGDTFTALNVDAPNLSASPTSGDFRFMDSRTFRPTIPADGIIAAEADLTLSAANTERPFVEIEAPDGVLTLRAIEPGLTLTIDGIWLSILGAAETRLVIDGPWSQVVLRSTTLDPGGARAAPPGGGPGEPIPTVTLEFGAVVPDIGGGIDDITVQSCILGPIVEAEGELDPCAVDTVRICDTITGPILMRNAALCLDRVTVVGDVITGSIDASETLVNGQVRVEDTQSGCFRFSAAHSGGRVPQAYESHFYAPALPFGTFLSTRFGDASYCQLSEIAPDDIRTGGEDGTEIGAYNLVLDPIKRADLVAKLDEFMPINAILNLVFTT